CVTAYPRSADAHPGSRPAPELSRARRIAQEHAGHLPAPGAPDRRPGTGGAEPKRDELAVLADMLSSDGAVLSASETLRAELSNAAPLATLGHIWSAQARRVQAARFTAALRDALPGPLAEDALTDPACTWLWRSLRQAETTGLDGADVLREAV